MIIFKMLLIMFKMLRAGGEHDLLLLIIFKMLVVALIPEEVDGDDDLDKELLL